MTSKQKLLEKYIQKHFPSQQTETQIQTQIPLQIPFLQKWLEKISQPPEIQQPKTNHQKPKTPTMYNLIPPNILKKEIPKLDQHTNITFTSHGRPIRIFFYHTHANIPSPTFIQRCIQVIHTLSEFAPKHCLQPPIHIYIYLTHAQKTIRHSEDIVVTLSTPPITIGEENVNTAFTTSCDSPYTINQNKPSKEIETQPPKEIILFRQEEVFKVLIHELFHTLGIDFSNNQSQTQQTAQMLRQFLNINISDLKLFETYTESWICILNTICLSVWDHDQSQHEIERQIQTRFQKERIFSLWQASKVIHYNQTSHTHLIKKCLKPSSCFLSSNHTQHQKTQHQNNKSNTKNKTQKQTHNKREYKENTQVFCYFLLKAAVFQKIDTFVTQFPPPFHHTEENQHHHAQNFAKFVLEAFQDSNFANKLQKMSALYLKYFHTHPRKEQWMFDTMRQTVNEIDVLS